MMKIKSMVLAAALVFNSFPGIVFAQMVLGEKNYFIEAGDVINVQVFPAEEFSKEVTVQPDGTIDIPLAGPVKVEGMRGEDLEKVLTAKFSKYVANPRITVNVRKFSSNRIAIIGETRGTGYFEYREGMKLLDLVAQAGGLADYPRADKVRIYRRVKGADGGISEELIKADISAVMNGQMEKNIALAAGDIVYVPRTRVYKGAKWLSDNLVPWFTLFTMGLTVGLVTRKN
ncbi:MAG: polysaccharide biosynthesis/export family protein [Elusimicrobiales bacterium]|jgi:polysaccharide export outer membrane protein